MNSPPSTPRLRSWLRPASRPTLRLEQLEDRTVPSSSIPLSGLGWRPLGGTIIGANPSIPLPVAGVVTSVSVPSGPAGFNTLYAGTPGGGAAKSVDGGQTWAFLTDNLPSAAWLGVEQNRTLRTGSVEVSPLNPDLVFVGLGEDQTDLGFAGRGILRNDRANHPDPVVVENSWRLIQGPATGVSPVLAFDGAVIPKFVFHPTDPNIIYAVVNTGFSADVGGTQPVSGVYRSNDAGVNWADVTRNITGGPLFGAFITDFLLDPTNPQVSYVGLSGQGVFRSSNSQGPANQVTYEITLGGTGTQVPGNSLNVIKLAFGLGTPNQPSRVYVLAASGGSSNQLFRSDDSGINFRRLDPLPVPTFTTRFAETQMFLLADPTSPNRLYFGGRGPGSVQVLTNADYNPDFGQLPNYINLTRPSTQETPFHGIREIRFDNTGAKNPVTGRPLEPGRLLLGTDAGLYRLQAPGGAVTTNANFLNNNLELVSLNGVIGPRSLNVQQFFSNALSPRDDNEVLGGTFLNGQAIFDDNGPFDPFTQPVEYNNLFGLAAPNGGEGARGTGGQIVYSQIDPNLVYRASNLFNQPNSNYNQSDLVQRSTDGGRSWVTAGAGIRNPNIVVNPSLTGPQPTPRVFSTPGVYQVPFVADPSPQIGSPEARLFLGTNVVNQSFDGGVTFSQYGPDLPFVTAITPQPSETTRITALGRGRERTDTIYAAVDDRFSNNARFGPAIYRYVAPPRGPINPELWFDVSPDVASPLLPPAMGAPPLPLPNSLAGRVLQLIVDPTDNSIVYAITESTGAGRVLRGTGLELRDNPGPNWVDITGDLPADIGNTPGLLVFSIAQDPNRLFIQPGNPNSGVFQQDDDLYIGTSQGVWKLTNPTGGVAFTWERVAGTGGGFASTGRSTGVESREIEVGAMPDVFVMDVEVNTTTGVLSAATFGRGIWQFQVRPFVRGQVFLDQNGDGDRDAPQDAPLAGAVVLANSNAVNPPSQFANTTTSQSGEYVFRSLPDGSYTFLPANSSNRLVDSQTKYYFTNFPITETVNEETTLIRQDLLVFDRITISGTAYIDLNANGVRDGGEPGAANFPVTLVAPAGTLDPNNPVPVATVTTDADGNYAFFGVGPLRPNVSGPSTPFEAGYQVTISKAGFQVTDPTVPTGPLMSNVDIPAADIDRTRVGVFEFGRLSGTVFEDINGDGVPNPGELPRAGFTVELRDAFSNNLVRPPVVTQGDGFYSFGDLNAGSYRITLAGMAGFVQTTAPFDAITIVSGTISGVNTPFLDIGVFAAAAITGVAYEDTNGNGVRDNGENPVPGVGVALINPLDNVTLATTRTDGAGNYSFANLFPIQRPGNSIPFFIRLADPTNGFVQSSFDPQPMILSGQTSFTTLGLFRGVSVSGFAFEDFDGNGVRDAGEPGLVNGLVTLRNANTGEPVLTTTTDGNGNFVFPTVGPIPGGAPYRLGAGDGFVLTTPPPPDFRVVSGQPLSGFVLGLFRTAAFTGVVYEDLVGNARLDADDPRLPGQTVQLVDAFGNVAATTTTDGNGFYLLAAGPGSLRVVHPVPAGVVPTTPPFGLITTRSGQPAPNQDFGDFRLFAVFGRVFNDLNGDGNAAGDPGAAGVTVQLVNAADGAVLAQTTTDGNGFYFLPNVGPGQFRVEVVGRSGLVATTPGSSTFTGFSGRNVVVDFGTFAQAAVGGNIYEDLDRNGNPTGGDVPAGGFEIQLLQNGAVVQTVVSNGRGDFGFGGLAPGAYTVRVADRLGWVVLTNGTQTVNLVSGQNATLAAIGTLRLASVSGSVFLDPNRNSRRDAAERGLTGGVVGLFDAAGTQIAVQPTDGNGNYAFFFLQSGTYTVRLLTAPSGFQPTRGGSVIPVTLNVGSVNPGNNVTGIDFGLLGRDRYALAADGGGGPRVQVFDALSNVQLQDFFVYEVTFTGGVRVSTGDVTGDGVDDLIVVPGKGGGPRVRVLDGVTQGVVYDYFAYEPTFTDGLFVAVGDVDGDGFADIVTGTAPGGGPRVTVFSGKTGTILADFFAYDSSFRGGVRVAVGDTDGDGVAEIITAPGVGGGPAVVVFGGPDFQPVSTFNAFEPGYTGGVFLASGPVGVNGRADIVVGSGQIYPGSPVPVPVVRVFDAAEGLRAEIEAFPGAYRSEVRVATFDRTGDGVPDVGVANGPGSPPRLRFLDGVNRRQIGDEQMPYEFGFTGGIFIG